MGDTAIVPSEATQAALVFKQYILLNPRRGFHMQLLTVWAREPESIPILQVDNKNAGASVLLPFHRTESIIRLIAILFELAASIGSGYGFGLDGNGECRAGDQEGAKKAKLAFNRH